MELTVKRTILIAISIFAFAFSSTGQTQQSKTTTLEETLVNLEKQSWEAWQKRDGKFFQEFLSDDHVEVGMGGPATKAQIVGFVGSPICVVKSYKVEKFRLAKFTDDIALLNYWAEQDTTCNGNRVPSPAWASSLYVKRGERWLNALYQQTMIPQK
jgi:hypothetical protein